MLPCPAVGLRTSLPRRVGTPGADGGDHDRAEQPVRAGPAGRLDRAPGPAAVRAGTLRPGGRAGAPALRAAALRAALRPAVPAGSLRRPAVALRPRRTAGVRAL